MSIAGLFRAGVIALTYLRRKRVQWELAETFGVSQSTISRAISAQRSPHCWRAHLGRFVPVAEELIPGRQYLVDGTFATAVGPAGRRAYERRRAGRRVSPARHTPTPRAGIRALKRSKCG